MPDKLDLLIDMQTQQTARLDSLHEKLDNFRVDTCSRVATVEERSANNKTWIGRLIAAVIAVVVALVTAAFKTMF